MQIIFAKRNIARDLRLFIIIVVLIFGISGKIRIVIIV